MTSLSIHKAEAFGIRGRTKKPVVMVCLQNKTDRQLTVQYLSESYEVVVSDCYLQDLEFDICLLDRPTFSQNRQEILEYKESKAPLIVPFLLFVDGNKWTRTLDPLWNVADDVVPIPLPMSILKSRVEAMLQIRKYSLELKQKNDKLSMYEQAMNVANAGILITDAREDDNPIIYANEGFEKLTGYSEKEILGENCRFLQKEDRNQEALDEIRSFVNTGEMGHAPLRNYRKDGSMFWNDLNIAPITDSSGNITHFVGVQHDITELVETHEKLNEERERYRLIAENSTDMIARHDEKGTYRYVSPSCRELLGYEPEELVGSNPYETVHPDDQKKVETLHDLLLNSNEPVKCIFRKKTKSGAYKWVESLSRAIRDPETNQVVEIQASTRDVSERVAYEEALKKEKDRFQKLTESSPIGKVIMNAKGRITFANEQAEEILGLERDKISRLMYNDPAWKITGVDGNPFPEEQLPFVQVKEKDEIVYDVEHAIEWPNGNRKIISVNAAPLHDDKGHFNGVIASISDITESKHKEKQLKEEREFVQAVVDNTPGIFYMLDENLNFVFWNKNMVRDLGYADEEIEKMEALDFIRKEEREYVFDKAREVIETGRAEIEIDLIDKQGNEQRHYLIGTRFERNGETYILGSGVDISERVDAEYESEQQKKLLSAVINQTESIIYVKDAKGRYRLVNSRHLELTGLEREEVIGKTDKEIFDNDFAGRVMANDQKVFETGKTMEFEENIQVGNEKRRFLSIKNMLKGVPGFENCLCGISTDITEREEAYRQLKERNKEKTCLYSIGNLNEIYDSVDKILEEAVDIIPKGFQYPEVAEAAIEYDGKIYATNNFEHTRWGMIAESQNFKSKSVAIKVVYLEERSAGQEGPFFKEERELINAIADTLASGIERIVYREKLEESEKRWAQLVNKNPGLVQIIDGDIIQFINPAGASLYGAESANELIGKSWTDFVSFKEEDQALIRKRIQSAIQGDINAPKVYKAWTVDETERYVELQSVPVIYKGRKVLMTVGQEVTERVKYEEELQQSLAEKEILLQEIHHRVKNNLAVISGLLQIQRFSTEDDNVNKVLSDSEMRIKSMALIHEKLYQAESLSEIDFKYYIEDLVGTIERTIKPDEHLQTHLNCDSVTLNVNQAVPCALILNELISNSVEHAFKDRNDGAIYIDLREKDNIVSIEVRDNGPGLPEDFNSDENQSMGFTIVNTLISQLNAEMEITNQNGAHIAFSFEKRVQKGSSSALVR